MSLINVHCHDVTGVYDEALTMFVDVSVEVVLISFDFVSILSGFCSFLKGVSFECIFRGSAEVNMSVSLNILKNGDYYNSVYHNSDFFF